MRNFRRLTGSIAVLSAVACVSFSPARAQIAHPIAVNACNPQPPTVTGPGFVPAYYPRTPYYWYDTYGYRYRQPPVVNNPTLGIDYVNNASVPATAIEFGLVARGHLLAEVRDVGTFSPGVEIKHKFGLSPNVFPIGTGFPRCVPLRVTFANGTTWRNPHLPALRRSIYQ